MIELKYVIWGAGKRGKRIFRYVGAEDVQAFIDNEESKIGNKYLGKKIISYEEYKNEYLDCYIIISCIYENEIIEILNRDNNHKYFRLSDCPGELQEPNQRDFLENYIVNNWCDPEKNVIYGISLYTFILNKWIKKNCGKYLKVVVSNIESIGNLKREYPDIEFCELLKINFNNISNILVVEEQNLHMLNNLLDNKVDIINLYDCSDKISAYHNPQIEKFYNLYERKRCFIIATGPSLEIKDLEKLKQEEEICISMNNIWRGFSKTSWRPDYYVASDQRIINELTEILENLESKYLFLADTSKDYWEKPHNKNILCHHIVWEISENRLPKFSEDFSKKSYMGATVTYICMQLAVYMGFKEIYLLGVDFTNADLPQGTKYAHFYQENSLESSSFAGNITLAYLAAKKYADEHNIKIFNATRGGKLEIFERVDFDKIFI